MAEQPCQSMARNSVKKKLNHMVVGEVVTIGQYGWRKRTMGLSGGNGRPAEFERTDDSHNTHNTPRLTEIILETFDVGGKVFFPERRPRKNLTPLEKASAGIAKAAAQLREGLARTDQKLLAAEQAISDSKARIKKLEAEKAELEQALDALGVPEQEEGNA